LVTSERSAEAGTELEALEYAGKVEAEKSEDQYTGDLAIVYRRSTANQRVNLIQARHFLKSGIDRYNKAEWNEAIQIFSQARELSPNKSRIQPEPCAVCRQGRPCSSFSAITASRWRPPFGHLQSPDRFHLTQS